MTPLHLFCMRGPEVTEGPLAYEALCRLVNPGLLLCLVEKQFYFIFTKTKNSVHSSWK